MENRFNNHHGFNYQHDRTIHLNTRERRDNITSRITQLLAEGAESINVIERSQFREESHLPHVEEQNVQTSSFIGIFPLLSKVFLFGFWAGFLVILSLGEWVLFYKIAMPALHSNNVLHFDYTNTGITKLGQIWPGSNAGSAEKVTERIIKRQTDPEDEFNPGSCAFANMENASRNFYHDHIPSSTLLQKEDIDQSKKVLLQSAPVATVDLFSNHDSWQHYHPDIVPTPKQKKRILKKGAPHYIEILLDLPESDTNREKIGIFSVVTQLQSSPPEVNKMENSNSNTTATTTTRLLASSTRTARMPHESFWISVVRKLICIIPHLLGAIPESRRVIVPSYRYFVESEEFPLRYVTVWLLMSPEKSHRGDIVEVEHAMLRIGEELTGMQLVLKEWFFTCATIGISVFFSLQTLFVLAIQAWWRRSIEQERDRSVLEDDASERLSLNGLDNGDDDISGDNDHNNDPNLYHQSFDDNNSESRSSQGQRRNSSHVEYMDQEQGEWEDLPQQPMGVAAQNGNHDGGRQTARETADSTSSSPHTQTEDVTNHVIPDN